MSVRASRRFVVLATIASMILALAPAAVAVPAYDFATPVFGLAARGRLLYVADSGAGVVRLGSTAGRLVVELPRVTDVAPLRRGRMWALTTGRRGSLFKIVDGTPRVVAGIADFEREVNPDGGEIDSNPFDLAKLGRGRVLVADAAANALLIVDHGVVDWVATLPDELVPTDNAKTLAGCPNPPPEFADVCELPDEIEAQAVTTSVAVGPDGALYLSELKGFPAPLGVSKIWRIEPDARHVECGTDPACTVVEDGFTSIVDINFDADGMLHVVEIDEASWLAVEFAPEAMLGGTVNMCDLATSTCTEEATGLTIPIAVAITGSGRVFAAVSALIPGEAAVIEIGAPAP